MARLDDFELPELEDWSPRPRRSVDRSLLDLEAQLRERVDALMASGELGGRPRREPTKRKRVKEPRRLRARAPEPEPVPVADLRGGQHREGAEVAPPRGRTLRQQLASANHRLKLLKGRVAALEKALRQAGVPVPPFYLRPHQRAP